MLILLPPSETKRTGGELPSEAQLLRHQQSLGAARREVRTALEAVSRDDDAAAKALKLGVKARGELVHNRALGSSGLLPAGERYTGVLYDALDVRSLDSPSRRWFDAHVAVQSALFGLIGTADVIPAYRLSASSRLPGLDGSLRTIWRAAHAEIDWERYGWILDLRSQDYASLAPLPLGSGAALHVAQRSPEGEVRALNHFNKAAKGDLVRRLAESQPRLNGERDLISWAKDAGLVLERHAETGELTLLTELGAPRTAAR